MFSIASTFVLLYKSFTNLLIKLSIQNICSHMDCNIFFGSILRIPANDISVLILNIPQRNTAVKPIAPIDTSCSSSTSSDAVFIMTGSYKSDTVTSNAPSSVFGSIICSATAAHRSMSDPDKQKDNVRATADISKYSVNICPFPLF